MAYWSHEVGSDMHTFALVRGMEWFIPKATETLPQSGLERTGWVKKNWEIAIFSAN